MHVLCCSATGPTEKTKCRCLSFLHPLHGGGQPPAVLPGDHTPCTALFDSIHRRLFDYRKDSLLTFSSPNMKATTREVELLLTLAMAASCGHSVHYFHKNCPKRWVVQDNYALCTNIIVVDEKVENIGPDVVEKEN